MSTIDALMAIRQRRGHLTGEIVVAEAAEPSHPLHDHFEWDDTVAGHQYRVVQALQLLRITFRPDPSKPTELRAFVALKGKETPRSDYVPVTEAMADPFSRELLLSQMERDWKLFKRRYEHMAEFAAFIAKEIA